MFTKKSGATPFKKAPAAPAANRTPVKAVAPAAPTKAKSAKPSNLTPGQRSGPGYMGC